MELEFPETIDARIKATIKAKNRCKMKMGMERMDSKDFIPASSMKCNLKMYPYYETADMTGDAMKEVKKEKMKFIESKKRSLMK